MRNFWLGAAAAGAILSASLGAVAQTPDDLASPRYGAWGVDLSGQQTGVKAGDDFFRFANGAYLQKLVIPPDRSSFGNFLVLRDLSERRVKALVEQLGAQGDVDASIARLASNAAAGGDASANAVKIGNFYKAFMDEARVEALGARPLAADLTAIRSAPSRNALAEVMGRAASSFHDAVFGLYIYADEKDPTRYAVYLSQAGLNLPDRDYYLKPQFAEQKAKYEAYVAQVLGLAGWPDPQASAKAIVELETRIAEVSWTRAEQRDRDKTYNAMTVAELEKAAPGFAWRNFMKGADLEKREQLVVTENTAIPKIAAIYAATPLDTLKAWSAFSLADNAAPYLSKAFTDAHFEFRSKTLSGQPQQRDRWKRAVSALESTMGEAVGQLYVAQYFPPEAKAKMDALVGELKTAMGRRIDRADWMSAQTKAQAHEKLAKFTVKIGFPTKWRDYSTLEIRPDDLYGDVERGVAHSWRRDVARLDQPVDRLEWGMTPQTVNAYYSSTMNEIVFPAAILQPPFFDPNADPAVNYGAIGAVIGHEITHGFDDEGRKSDGEGRLREWWTPADAAKFEAAAEKLGAQYGIYEPLPGAKVNPELTMGENVADLGGLLTALDAYHQSLDGKPAPVIDGLTGDQRLFLAYAQVWREKRRDDSLRQQVVSDPHSPAEFRVNGVVRNVDAWYQAFDIKPGDKLYLPPEQRVRIW
jgi:putative endopeptidase